MRLLIYFISIPLFAITIKVGVLAPEGTTWSKNLKKMVKEVNSETKGKVRFKMYYGGVAGDEPDVLRKIRIGQMHGGVFTGRAIGDIFSDIRVMEVPFNFKGDRAKFNSVLDKLRSEFDRGLEKNGFINLGFFEIGNVYLVSTKRVESISQMKGIKIWAWEGDKVAESLVSELGLVSVPLALPDVLSSLSTGIIDAAYSSPMGVLALQWNSKIKYFLDYPVTYSLGAFLVSKKKFLKIEGPLRAKVLKIARKHIHKTTEETIEENTQAKQALFSMGVEKVDFDSKDVSRAHEINQQVFAALKKSKYFSQNIVNRFNKAMMSVK